MRVKLFVRDKGVFTGWRRFVGQLEDEVNDWLANNPGIRIVHVMHSSNGGSLDSSKLFISVWYEEGGYPFAPASATPGTPASQGISRTGGPAGM